MNGFNAGIITSRDQFQKRIQTCEEEASGKHWVIIGGTIGEVVGMQPEPPFWCHSVLVVGSSLSGENRDKWLHICFTANEAAHIAVLSKERMKLLTDKKRAEMEEGKEERLAALAADLELDLDLDDGEDLGTINAGINEFPDD